MTAAPAGSVPTLDIDLYSADVLADPWPVLRRIREAGPLVWNAKGYWMTGHDRTCRQILNRPPEIGQEGMISAFFGAEAFISTDDKARHGALRNVWVSSFSRDYVAGLAGFVRTTANAMLDRLEGPFRAGEPIDLMGGLCRQLPAFVIAHMMGVADAMIPEVVLWSDLMADSTAGGFPIDYDNDPHWLAGEQAKKDLAAYLVDQFAYRRRVPGDDLISRIVHSEIGATLPEQAMMVNTRQLLFAGNETTAKWLGNIFDSFGGRPDVCRAVNADRGLLPAALEEVMRWQGVTQVLPRGVKGEGVSVEGIDLPNGAEIILLLGAAGRDPERWDDPDSFDIHRPARPHLGFGFGLHSCLGAVLARMEAFEVASAVLDRFPDYAVRRPVPFGNFSLRGPTALWIESCAK